MAKRKELISAYRSGQRSSRSSVDSGVAADRWSRRHCQHPYDQMCALEHAWWDGFADYDLDRPPFLTDNAPADTEYTFSGDDWERKD